jgi:myo-inositol-1(or 4)-monophosphatase
VSWDFVATASEAVMRAGALQKARYGQHIEVRHKGEINLVTEVDQACERLILELLRERFPQHDIVTEETDLARTGARHVWFVDPLDGTTNVAHGYPFFCASVALAAGDEVVAGAVYDPIKDELFTAERGAGAFVNGRRLRTSTVDRLIDSLLITGFPYDLRQDIAGTLRLFHAFIAQARAVRRDGAAALDLAYVAAGRADGFFEERLQPWDVLAGGLMVEEAGGRLTRFDGARPGLGADEIVACGTPLHPHMLEVLSEARRGALSS